MYSDYRVKCVCPSKKDAEQVATKMRGDEDGWDSDARAEPFPIITGDVEKVEYLRIAEEIRDDGERNESSESVRSIWPFGDIYQPVACEWRWVRAPVHQGKGGRLEVGGIDHERVRKVFSDRRAQLIADDAMRASRERRGRVA